MFSRRFAVLPALALLLAACEKNPAAGGTTTGPVSEGLRVINAYTQPVDVLVDGALAATAVPAGTLDSVAATAGAHTVALRPTGSSATVTLQVKNAAGALKNVAAIRSAGALAASMLDDTNAIVPVGATKVRVLHLAPNAGEIQVFRTQPDWSTPVEWKFPFLYDSSATLDPLADPYYQSTVGTWEIRAWRKPSEVSLGWSGTTARVTVPVASGEKRTVIVLDKPGGGIQLSVIE